MGRQPLEGVERNGRVKKLSHAVYIQKYIDLKKTEKIELSDLFWEIREKIIKTKSLLSSFFKTNDGKLCMCQIRQLDLVRPEDTDLASNRISHIHFYETIPFVLLRLSVLFMLLQESWFLCEKAETLHPCSNALLGFINHFSMQLHKLNPSFTFSIAGELSKKLKRVDLI